MKHRLVNGGDHVSLRAQVDVNELIKRIKAVLCPECMAKVDKVTVPMAQVVTIEELFK